MPTIFIQDADASIMEVLTILLETEGYHVIGADAFTPDVSSIFLKHRISLALLDFKLDGKDCIDFCRLIKQYRPGLPVIAMSCNSNISSCYQHAGFDGYLEKPFDIYLLIEKVRKYILPEVMC